MSLSRRRPLPLGLIVAVTLCALAAPRVWAATDLLPDIIIRQNDLFDHDVVTNIEPGRTHLRLSNGTPNIGVGKLYLYGVTPAYEDGTQDVMQRVYADDGSFYDRPAGRFVYHATHQHIHLEDWCVYRLRELLPGNGVGATVVEGAKTSFCVLDLAVHDSSLPNFDSDGEFHTCSSTIQGLSVGWVDVYNKSLPGQNIDITGVADGTYWLESEADPDNHILESNETNNVTRIQVTIGSPAPINPDPYEPNGSLAAVDGRPEGGVNSPNLGPCGPQRVIGNLTIHQVGDDDYYKFYMNHKGTSSDFVRIEFQAALGDLDMGLYDAAGTQLAASTGTSDSEEITLRNRSEGWYYVRVYGFSVATNPSYQLTINPPQNNAPAIAVLAPPAGNVDVQHASENYTVTWNATDPEGDLTWVSVYVNTVPALNGDEILLPSSMNTPGGQGFAVINSAELNVGMYWVYCSVTDGGTVTGSWSQGTVTFVEPVTAVPELPGMGGVVTQVRPAYPNPFHSSTTLRLELAQKEHVRWCIYDVRGSLVRTLLDGQLPAGRHVTSWDGTDTSGRPVASGVYYAVVEGQRRLGRQKLVLLK